MRNATSGDTMLAGAPFEGFLQIVDEVTETPELY